MPKNPSAAPSSIERFSSLHDHVCAQNDFEIQKNQVVYERKIATMEMCRDHVRIPDERVIKSLQPRLNYPSAFTHVSDDSEDSESPDILNTAFIEPPATKYSKKKASSKVRKSGPQRKAQSVLANDSKKMSRGRICIFALMYILLTPFMPGSQALRILNFRA